MKKENNSTPKINSFQSIQFLNEEFKKKALKNYHLKSMVNKMFNMNLQSQILNSRIVEFYGNNLLNSNSPDVKQDDNLNNNLINFNSMDKDEILFNNNYNTIDMKEEE